MKLKMTPDGHAVVKNGMPVYVRADGTEMEIDGAAAWKLALSKHFETSPVMAGLKIPHDLAAAAFSESFRIDGGKLVAVDKHGIQLYSPTRHGEAADFDEAFAQLVDRYQSKAMIQREGGAPAGGDAPAGQQRTGSTISRTQFDSLPPASRAKFFKEGGRIGDGTSPAGQDAPASTHQGSGKNITREVFEGMSPADRMTHVKSGGSVV